MIVRILGDSNFDGILVAEFLEEDEPTHRLEYDLENWKDMATNGNIGGDYIKIINPEPMNITFNQEYEMDQEQARKAYKLLYLNGWKERK